MTIYNLNALDSHFFINNATMQKIQQKCYNAKKRGSDNTKKQKLSNKKMRKHEHKVILCHLHVFLHFQILNENNEKKNRQKEDPKQCIPSVICLLLHLKNAKTLIHNKVVKDTLVYWTLSSISVSAFLGVNLNKTWCNQHPFVPIHNDDFITL